MICGILFVELPVVTAFILKLIDTDKGGWSAERDRYKL
jgi:hypothetical protein